MSDKVRFSRAEDDTIIKFVRTNPCLYNKRGSRLYDKPKKIRLWKELADKLGKDDNSVKKRWATMRDYFIRHRESRLQNIESGLSERCESLMFLLETTVDRATKVSDKVRFSPDEDDIIIEFVRKNPCLYNKRIHDKQLKIRLWKDLADKLNKDDNSVIRRWASMRDYFIRSYETKLQNPDSSLSERFESMMFLVETSLNKSKGRTSPNAKTSKARAKQSQPNLTTPEHSCEDLDDEDTNPLSTFFIDVKSEDSSMLLPDASSSPTPAAATAAPASTSADHLAETNRLLHEMLGRMSAMDSSRTGDEDPSTRHVRTFFAVMADTVSRLPAHVVARLKMDVARLVGEAELASLEAE